MNTEFISPVPRSRFPYWKIPGLFLALIAAGTVLLKLPAAHRPGQALSWIDALFTAVSAVCVTGLVTVNTAEVLSGFGEVVLLGLIQMGGIGIVTSGTLFMLVRGQRLTFADERFLAATLGRLKKARPVDVFIFTCLFVALCEAAGMVALFPLMSRADPGRPVGEMLWEALFHSVSAFCNAGFSDEATGAARWRETPSVLWVLSFVVILGGIGMPTLLNFRYFRFWRRKPEERGRLALQTRIVLRITLVLLVLGAVAMWLLERNALLKDMPWGQSLSLAWFQSTTLRTAGFSAVDIGQMQGTTLLLSMLLMFIGGSPGSMAGGIKTVTFALILAIVWTSLRRRQDVELFRRRISSETRAASLMVVFLAATVIIAGILLLMATEASHPASQTPHRWLALMFEGVSAFCTVGLTTGVTPLLTAAGKLTVMALMFVGRVGPLLLAFHLATPVHPQRVRFAEENVSLG